MAKKRPQGNQTVEPVEQVPLLTGGTDHQQVEHGQQAQRGADLGTLTEEVQSFLDRRSELARKLAQEIDATEKKLAELKRAAGLLFPENDRNGRAEPERRPKKMSQRRSNKHRADVSGIAPAPSEHITETGPTVSAGGEDDSGAASSEGQPGSG